MRHSLSVENGIILKGCQIVIPKPLRHTVLQDLHVSHQGQERTKQRARQVGHWPGLSNDIDNMVRNCPQCRRYRSSQQKELLFRDPVPTLLYQRASVDIFSCSVNIYIVYTDQLSGWPCVDLLAPGTKSKDVIRTLRQWFSDVGVPQELVTNGGPQFTPREFSAVCKRWQVRHIWSTPHYPQVSGSAEAAVTAMKHLVYKITIGGDLNVDEFRRGLIEWRNTPRGNGRSPSQILFGRPLQSFVLANHRTFATEWQAKADKADETGPAVRKQSAARYNASARPLGNLKIGETVDIQDPHSKRWTLQGQVVGIGRPPDYYVKLTSGRVYWRNRRFLRPYQTYRLQAIGLFERHRGPASQEVRRSSHSH